MIYGQIGRISRKKSSDWKKKLYTPVHAFIVEGSRTTSLCGRVRVAEHIYSMWRAGYGNYMKPVSPLDFELRPCYYCKKRHKDAIVAEVMLTEGDKA